MPLIPAGQAGALDTLSISQAQFRAQIAELITLLLVTSTSNQGPPGVGVPAGGSVGQILRKSGSADYATEWASLGTAAYAAATGFATAAQGVKADESASVALAAALSIALG